jgi:hypothetical protein
MEGWLLHRMMLSRGNGYESDACSCYKAQLGFGLRALRWVRNRGEHQGCLSEVDVWVSTGSDTQKSKHRRDTTRFIMVWAFEYSDLRVGNAQSGDYNGGDRERLVGDHSVLS